MRGARDVDLGEYYTDAEIAEIRREAVRLEEIFPGEYEDYIVWAYEQAKAADDARLAALAGELRGLPGCE